MDGSEKGWVVIIVLVLAQYCQFELVIFNDNIACTNTANWVNSHGHTGRRQNIVTFHSLLGSSQHGLSY